MNRLKTAVSVLVLAMSMAAAGTAEGNDTYIPPEYVNYCEEIGARYSLCPEVLEAMIETESSGNPRAYSNGCCGLMQINADVHKDRMARLGVKDIYDPYGNILVGADKMAELFGESDDFGWALLKYNGTRNAEDKALRNEFTDYANKIMARAYELEEVHHKHDY